MGRHQTDTAEQKPRGVPRVNVWRFGYALIISLAKIAGHTDVRNELRGRANVLVVSKNCNQETAADNWRHF
jgi:hypothetical protein